MHYMIEQNEASHASVNRYYLWDLAEQCADRNMGFIDFFVFY